MKYQPCGYAVEVWPAWKSCGKPVSTRASDKIVRCSDHARGLPYWPSEQPDIKAVNVAPAPTMADAVLVLVG